MEGLAGIIFGLILAWVGNKFYQSRKRKKENSAFNKLTK